MSNSLFNIVDKESLHFFYLQIKSLIDKSGIGVVDITPYSFIPKLTKTGSTIYYIDGANESSITKGNTCDKLPTNVSKSDIFILDNCYTGETGSIINMYVLFDGEAIFIAKAKATSETNITYGSWVSIFDPYECYKEVTQQEYDALPESKNTDGKIYFIKDPGPDVIHMPDIINNLNHKGGVTLDNLPTSGTAVGDFYFILDKLEGRYWDGTVWKTVI